MTMCMGYRKNKDLCENCKRFPKSERDEDAKDWLDPKGCQGEKFIPANKVIDK